MPTINDKKMAESLMESNGYYLDDPRVVKIVSYFSPFGGGQAYGLIYAGQPLYTYRESGFVIQPMTMWEVK